MILARSPRSGWTVLARGSVGVWLGALFGACARFDFDLLQVSPSAGAAGASGGSDSGAGAAPAAGGDGPGGAAAAGVGGAAGSEGIGGAGSSGGAVGSGDAGPGVGGSGGDPLAACAVLGPFGAAEPLTGLGAGSFFSPTVFDDELALIFASASPGDLFSARRASRGSLEFGAVRPLQVNSEYDEVTPWASADGLVLLFASNRPGSLSLRDLMQSTQATLDDPFGTPTFISELNTGWTENLPSLHDGGRALLFTSERPGGAPAPGPWMCGSRRDRARAGPSATRRHCSSSTAARTTPEAQSPATSCASTSPRSAPAGPGGETCGLLIARSRARPSRRHRTWWRSTARAMRPIPRSRRTGASCSSRRRARGALSSGTPGARV